MIGSEKSLMSPRLKIKAQGAAYRCSKVKCEDHSAIQAPILLFDKVTLVRKLLATTLTEFESSLIVTKSLALVKLKLTVQGREFDACIYPVYCDSSTCF